MTMAAWIQKLGDDDVLVHSGQVSAEADMIKALESATKALPKPKEKKKKNCTLRPEV